MQRLLVILCISFLSGCSVREIGTPRNNLDLSKIAGMPTTSTTWLNCKPLGLSCTKGVRLIQSSPYFSKTLPAESEARSELVFDVTYDHSPSVLWVVSLLTLGLVPMYDQESYYLQVQVRCGGDIVKKFDYSRKFHVLSGILGAIASTSNAEANEGAGIGFLSPERMTKEFLFDLQNGAMDEIVAACPHAAPPVDRTRTRSVIQAR